jgi:hypothetical protein
MYPSQSGVYADVLQRSRMRGRTRALAGRISKAVIVRDQLSPLKGPSSGAAGFTGTELSKAKSSLAQSWSN